MSGFGSVLFAILLFSILIFVHELGHFLAAKASGVQVNEFAMFMGPAIFKKKVGETLYSIRCIPLVGYCAMEGEAQDTDNPRSFQKAAWWKRLIILVAGAAMNFLFGILFFAIFFIPVKEVGTPVITEFTDCCTFNNQAGLHLGDEIVEIDGEKIYVASNISTLFSLNGTGTHDIVVVRDGERIEFEDFTMAHTHKDENGQEYLHYGIAMGKEDATLGVKLKTVWNTTIDNVRNVRLSLQMLFTGKAGFADLSGPVGIVDMMSDVATSAESWTDAALSLLYFGGFLAVNLGVMNLLPIPALVGGRVVALLLTTAIESVIKKKIDPKFEGYIHAAGMILLVGLMAVIMFKDIFTIFKG